MVMKEVTVWIGFEQRTIIALRTDWIAPRRYRLTASFADGGPDESLTTCEYKTVEAFEDDRHGSELAYEALCGKFDNPEWCSTVEETERRRMEARTYGHPRCEECGWHENVRLDKCERGRERGVYYHVCPTCDGLVPFKTDKL